MSASVDQLVAASGLSPLFARSAIQRAIERCGVRLDRMKADEVERLAGELEKVIAIFDPAGAKTAIRRVRDVLSAT
jgi:hypothetical protein